MKKHTDTSAQAQATAVDELLASLTPEQVIEAREKLGPLCLWCGAPATLLCDSTIGYRVTCDAPICPTCAASVHYTGCSLPGPCEGSFDTCPACVHRKGSGERCYARTPDAHGVMVRGHAAAHVEARTEAT